ncbi:hypothetical protein H1C71_012126, partial [Ictidomys tridecemlineatus]
SFLATPTVRLAVPGKGLRGAGGRQPWARVTLLAPLWLVPRRSSTGTPASTWPFLHRGLRHTPSHKDGLKRLAPKRENELLLPLTLLMGVTGKELLEPGAPQPRQRSVGPSVSTILPEHSLTFVEGKVFTHPGTSHVVQDHSLHENRGLGVFAQTLPLAKSHSLCLYQSCLGCCPDQQEADF